jgi:hypothetical protein
MMRILQTYIASHERVHPKSVDWRHLVDTANAIAAD